MEFVFSLIESATPGLIWPSYLVGWLGLAAMLILVGWMARRWHEPVQALRERWWLGLALLALAPLLATFFGLRLPGEVRPFPNTPIELDPPALMFFSALPWVIAGGLLGPLPAAVIGFASGTVLALYETHSPFTPLEIAILALLFSVAVRQNYRTLFYRLLRHPLGSGLLVIVVYVPILIFSTLFSTNDSLAVRLDYAFTQTWLILAARGGEILLACLAAQALVFLFPNLWGRKRALVPSPSESNIQTRFLYVTVPFVALLVLTLIIGDWIVAGNAAESMIEQRLSSTARVAAESLPYFTETGQNLILTLADEELLETPPARLTGELEKRLRSVPYFRQLFLFDSSGEPISGYPAREFQLINPTNEEETGISLALKGVSTQVYVVPPLMNETSAQISFIAAIRDEDDNVLGALLGRTDLNTNPFTQPVIQALANMSELEGQGMILSEKGIILYHPVTTEIMKQYPGASQDAPYFRNELSATNARQYVYYHPVVGRPWAIVLTVPMRVAQEMSLTIAVPLLVMLLVFSTLAIILMRISLGTVTTSLQVLAQEAAHISYGRLDRPLPIKGVDEIGLLSMSFEQMRVSLKARLDELNSLLQVSQGVAANLDIAESVIPILKAGLGSEACAARLVLIRDVTLESDEGGPVVFGIGPAEKMYAHLDEQLFEILNSQDMISLTNVARTRRLQIQPGKPHPGALLAMAVRHENRYYGVFWVAYDRPRNFSDEEIRFLTTLSGEAALAATSARLYASAEVGRQRLEAVLASSPDPVLVIDEHARLLLLNPAAVHVPGLIISSIEGQSIGEVIAQPELIDLLTVPSTEHISSREVSLTNGRIYYASVSPVLAEGRPMGKVCILRDITHFKELEQLKSDFVATVSHDLRSPLTLMRGYATMLQMVGDLNDQQKGYVRKIVAGVENMARLVNNLLDLGRIETGIGLQIERISVCEIADEVINSLQPQAVQKDIRLAQELSGLSNQFVVQADRALVQQAVYNLVENAIKYTPVGGQVRVRMEKRQASVLVEVHDTGIGIAPLDLPHLFEKFYRSGRREAYQQRGTGLGLAIVRSIAERHGGRVWVDSQLGKGSIFLLEVPCEQPQRPNGDSG
jgi:PAS domain S-box-containing protein